MGDRSESEINKRKRKLMNSDNEDNNSDDSGPTASKLIRFYENQTANESSKSMNTVPQQKSSDTVTELDQVIDIFPNIDKSFIIKERAKCVDINHLINTISDLNEYPKNCNTVQVHSASASETGNGSGEKVKVEDYDMEEAKDNGDLIECGCCFENTEYNKCLACNNGDIFCYTCVRMYAETRIGDGLTDVPCLSACGGELSLRVLRYVLHPCLYEKLQKQIQIAEVRSANIEGLEECPFCEYATVPADGSEVFACLNPDCTMISCRQCRKASHAPLPCEKVETDAQTEARKYVENEMTKALVRECYQCKKSFVKTSGCNSTQCSCGAKMCYVCRQPVTDYSHFNGQGGTEFDKCPLFTTEKLLHVDAVKARAEEAIKELGVKLVHDPTKILPTAADPMDLPDGMVQNDRFVLDQAIGHLRTRVVQQPAGTQAPAHPDPGREDHS